MLRPALHGLAAGVALLLACPGVQAFYPFGGRWPRVDAYGDPLPPGAVARLGTVRFRHAAPVLTVWYLPEGILYSSGQDNTTRAWDLATGRPRYVATGTSLYGPGPGREWRIEKGRTRLFLKDGRVTFRDVATDQELPGLDGIAGRVADMTVTPDGKGIVTAADDVRVWETATRKERLRFQGHVGSVYAVEVSSDGRRAASTGRDRNLLVWDLGTGKILGKEELLAPNCWSGPAFSPDNKTLVVTDGSHALVFRDAATGRRLEPPVAAEGYLSALAASPDGRSVAAASYDGTVGIWDVRGAKRLRLLKHDRGGARLAFSADGRLLAASGTEPASAVRVWEVATGKERCLLAAPEPADRGWHVGGLVFAADGRRLTCLANGRSFTWDVPGAGLVRASSGRGLGEALSPDGGLAASAGMPPEFFFQPDSFRHSPQRIKPPALRRDTLSLQDTATGLPLVHMSVLVNTASYNLDLPGLGPMIGSRPHVTFSPDGRLVLVPRLHGVRVWETASGKVLRELPGPLALGLKEARAPEMNHPALARGGHRFGGPKLNISDLNPLQHASFGADGRTVLLAWHDGTAAVYDLLTGTERRRLQTAPGAKFYAWSPDRSWLATGHEDTQVLVWETFAAQARAEQAAAITDAEVERLWEDLAAEAPLQAYQAIAKLAASPRAVASLAKRLRPQATAEEERATRLVRELDHEKFAVREAAARDLKALGRHAVQVLLAELRRDLSLETRRRIEALLGTIPAGALVVDRLVPAGEALRRYRALQVLERAGTAEARDALERLADGPPHAALTAQAKRALVRVRRERAGWRFTERPS